MQTVNEHLFDWLRDAHALEQQIETLLRGQRERIENYPDLRLRIDKHLEDTLMHQETINQILQRCGEDTSALKDWTAKLMASGQNLLGTAMSDEVIKGAMTLYVFTHVAISSYAVLIAAAEAANSTETANALKYIIEDEIVMGDWLYGNLPLLTQSFLTRAKSDNITAKR